MSDIEQSIHSSYRQINKEWHEKNHLIEQEVFLPGAALSINHSRRQKEPTAEDYRTPYKRDLDRILHSNGYSRYVDKTQVVYLVKNDHISQRSIHVQLVASYARGLAQTLGFNCDLVEAIALGHDVGHAPFGHEGEEYLSALSEEYGEGSFTHSWQSCRLFKEIEPLNLGFAVYDGFLCHDGGMADRRWEPLTEKGWEAHSLEMERKKVDPEADISPATLEGCLVKLCDTISYLARDIEDAVLLNLLERESIPSTILGRDNSSILDCVAHDLIEQSWNQPFLLLSEEVYEALRLIRSFNFEHIYMNPVLKVESKRIETAYRTLFEELLKQAKEINQDELLWRCYLHDKPERYIEETTPARIVIDYISGMTDGYFVRTLESLVVPKSFDIVAE